MTENALWWILLPQTMKVPSELIDGKELIHRLHFTRQPYCSGTFQANVCFLFNLERNCGEWDETRWRRSHFGSRRRSRSVGGGNWCLRNATSFAVNRSCASPPRAAAEPQRRPRRLRKQLYDQVPASLAPFTVVKAGVGYLCSQAFLLLHSPLVSVHYFLWHATMRLNPSGLHHYKKRTGAVQRPSNRLTDIPLFIASWICLQHI